MKEPYPLFETEQYRGARRGGSAYTLQISGRLFRQLRKQFTWRLGRALGKRAEQTRGPIATVWYDALGRIGNAQVIAYMAPQDYDTEIPLIPRIAVNNYIVRVTRARAGRLGCPWGYEPWPAMELPRLELSTTPEELLDFVPWIANLVEHHERGAPLQEPPHPCDVARPELRDAVDVWTGRARGDVAAYGKRREALLQEVHEHQGGMS